MYQAIEYIADNYLGYTSELKARLQYLKDCNLHIVKGDI